MKSQGELYFDQTGNGESRWWSWCVGLWFTILGAIFWQNAFIAPIPAISGAVDPEAEKIFIEANAEVFATIDFGVFAMLMAGFVLSCILGTLFWCLNRAFKGTAQKIFGVLTGIAIIFSVIFLVKFVPLASSEAINKSLTTMIGLSPVSYMLMLMSFPAVLVGLYLVQKFLHHRTILGLHTIAKSFRWTRTLQAMGITFAVYGVFTVVSHLSGFSQLAFVFDPSRFFAFAIVSLLFIPLQSATEEILIRGYMNQGLVSVLKNKWVAFTLSSLAFMSLHLANPEASSAASESPGIFFLTMSSYFLFGFLLSVMVDFEGGLEAAIGVHAANNLFAAIFVNYENSVLPTPSMFLAKMNTVVDVPTAMCVLALVTYLIYRTRKPIETVTYV